ncbi:putative thioredoxin domain-containing protein 15 isoform 2 [Scophthalmus maximus]|uniref:Putative thioredoxin domain-containing protein 15 isoform 2 n=1 Tax=Scophthalmus maximus TaxID=52904 RepID=A0A2U9B839_SCOMX|nr:thioredoxin domain-containing protein 15 [Scophthalmus maximus]AWP00034.1 putative thioredoxin domain-containing protein 15 isoform 2 [Scophthalmus maximus]
MTGILSRLCLSYVLLFTCHHNGLLRFSTATAQAHDESLEHRLSEEASPDLENSPKFVESEDLETLPKRQFKTAEIADAVMGTEAPIDPSDIESLFPKNVKDFQSGFSPPCDENSGECDSSVEAAKRASLEETSTEPSQQVTLDMVHVDVSTTEEQNATETAKTFKVNCDQRNITGMDSFSVHVLNASQDLMEFLNANGTECSVVLFFTSWCQFSASLAPHFNALPRVFPSMHFLALDASQHSSLSTRFGTVAVPNILLFQGAKPMARFNHTDRTLETLTSFIANQTGFEAGADRNLTEADRLGPLPGVPVKSIDWLLVFSILFITGFSLYAILRTDSIRWLIPGQEHEHQD